MDGLHTVGHVFSQLLLPISQGNIEPALGVVQTRLEKKGLVAEAERADYLRFEIDKWRDGAQPSKFLKTIVRESLLVEEILGDKFPRKYFSVHDSLTSSGQLRFEDATALLSHSNLAAQLLIIEKLSCAQVAEVLSARRGGFEYNWNQLQIIASAFGVRPVVDNDKMMAQSELDVAAGKEKFADATPHDCITVIAEVGESLGYPGDLVDHLSKFYPSRASFVPQYSVILNTNLLVVEEYDHPVSAAYEFTPRGKSAKELQAARHPSYVAKESAYLNNSKGASFFDRDWAWSRLQSVRTQALALADIFEALNRMAYPARRELASWIRPWLMRIEEDYVEHVAEVRVPGIGEIDRFFSELSTGNSRTYGILEQRAVDFLATAMFVSTSGEFDVLGRGDSVSASNTSRLKMGDIEFKSRISKKIVAFEAHGGPLSDFYVDIHADSLRKTILRRRIELEQLGGAAAWAIEIVFVAHDISRISHSSLPSDFDGYHVNWSFRTFAEVWSQVRGVVDEESIVELFNEYVRDPVASRWVSDDSKRRFNVMAGELD